MVDLKLALYKDLEIKSTIRHYNHIMPNVNPNLSTFSTKEAIICQLCQFFNLSQTVKTWTVPKVD